MLPLLLGGGMRLTPALSEETQLTLEHERSLPGGSVEIVYQVGAETTELPGHDPGWAPAPQRRS